MRALANAPRSSDEHDLRGLMFSIAYRMTGSVTEAEDLVQEAFVRLERARRGGVVVESEKAYAATTTTRLAIDHMRSARVRRESYVGTWLPEPIVADLHESPEEMAELSDSLSMAFLVLLERLSPVERAVFLLHEVFDYDYEDIAEIVDKSQTNCRQILTRARRHIDAHHARYEATAEQGEALLQSFLAAARDGDFSRLASLLARDAVFYGDGGGQALSVAEPLRGGASIASFVLEIFDRLLPLEVSSEPATVNGAPGVLTRDREGKLMSVLSLEVRDGLIRTLRSVLSPDKLRHLGPVSTTLRIERLDDDSQH